MQGAQLPRVSQDPSNGRKLLATSSIAAGGALEIHASHFSTAGSSSRPTSMNGVNHSSSISMHMAINGSNRTSYISLCCASLTPGHTCCWTLQQP
jgi:hypothetical protein